MDPTYSRWTQDVLGRRKKILAWLASKAAPCLWHQEDSDLHYDYRWDQVYVRCARSGCGARWTFVFDKQAHISLPRDSIQGELVALY